MGLKESDIRVFKLNNSELEIIGVINQFSGIRWPEKYLGFSTFELWVPVTKENSELLKKGNILWCSGKVAAVIEIIKTTLDEDGNLSMNVKGRSLEMLLTERILWNTYSTTVKKNASTVIYEIVNENCINPTDTKRKIPFLELAPDEKLGSEITIQITGGDVYTAISDIASESDLGFDIIFDPLKKKMIFKVTKGIDRSINQDVVDPIVFSTDMEDILKSLYYTNNQDFKNIALIAGELPSTGPSEASGSPRLHSTSGDVNSIGFDRRELYVDARDIRTSYRNEAGEEIIIPVNEYKEMLSQRGSEKLSQFIKIENFEANIRTFGNIKKEFGIDYDRGDLVTIIDKRLGVTLNARIEEVIESFSGDYMIELVFGYQYPTIITKMKRFI